MNLATYPRPAYAHEARALLDTRGRNIVYQNDHLRVFEKIDGNWWVVDLNLPHQVIWAILRGDVGLWPTIRRGIHKVPLQAYDLIVHHKVPSSNSNKSDDL